MKPGTQAPRVSVKTTEGKIWTLGDNQPEKFSLIVFYRGLHCPICKTYLESLSKSLADLKKQGVSEIIAISGDTKEKALKAKQDWKIKNLNVGCEMKLSSMANWGLFISEAIKESEPKHFGEPGLFIVDQEGKLFYCNTSNMPFARPPITELIKGLEFINSKGYPRRGTVSYDQIEVIERAESKVDRESELEMVDNHIITHPKKEKPVPPLNSN